MTGTPRDVLTAMKVDFGFPMTGYLLHAIKSQPVVMAMVYGDARQRFQDGTVIRTSAIVRATSLEGYVLLWTFSGSCYVVVSWQASCNSVSVKRTVH